MSIIQSIRRVCLGTIGLAAAVAFIAGCDEIDKMNEDAAKRPPINMPPQLVDAPGNEKPKAAAPANGTAVEPTPNATASADQAQSGTTLQKADAGVAAHGQGLGGGIITEPIHQYFMMNDRINFMNIQHQADIWKAAHNNKYPKNKDEYIKEILVPCNVDLPELPPGHRYVYDAQKGELDVESGGPAQ